MLVDVTGQKVRCNYCLREFSGGVYIQDEVSLGSNKEQRYSLLYIRSRNSSSMDI